MKHFLLILMFPLFLSSCTQNETEQTEIKTPTPEQNETEPKNQQLNNDSVAIDSSSKNRSAVEEQILDISNEFKRINALKMAPEKYTFFCDTDGTVTYYTSNGKVVKITIDWGFIGDGSSSSEYYYKEDKLIFAHETYIGGPANGPDTTTEFRTYVHNDKAIRYIKNQTIIACATCQFNAKSREYEILSAYTTHNIKAALCN